MTVEVGQAVPPWVLRPARPGDYARFVELFTELGVDDPPPPPPVWEAELVPLTVFVEGPEGVAGYAATEPMGEGVGYVGQVVVAPSSRGQGLGRWVMERLAERLKARGCQRWVLYVKRDNTPALRLYASVGMRPVRQASTLRLARAQVRALPAAPPGLEVVPVTPADYGALTAAWRMIPGKLERYGAKSSHQLYRLVHPGGAAEPPLGMMDQRAAGRVLFPFFAASPGHARRLIEAAFARLPEDVTALTVVVTDDAPLDALLREAGAEVRHEMLELSGPLP